MCNPLQVKAPRKIKGFTPISGKSKNPRKWGNWGKLKLKAARGSNESNDDPEGFSYVLAPKSPTKSETNINQIIEQKFNHKGSKNEEK
jgi:hypothetical protein